MPGISGPPRPPMLPPAGTIKNPGLNLGVQRPNAGRAEGSLAAAHHDGPPVYGGFAASTTLVVSKGTPWCLTSGFLTFWGACLKAPK